MVLEERVRAVDDAGDDDVVELEPLGLVDRGDEDAVAHDVARAEVGLLEGVDLHEVSLQLRVERRL